MANADVLGRIRERQVSFRPEAKGKEKGEATGINSTWRPTRRMHRIITEGRIE